MNKLKLGEYVKDNLFPVACDSFGNYIMIGLSNGDTGNIYFSDHEQGNKAEYLTDSFKKFVDCCKSEMIRETPIRSIKEREDALIANGRDHVIPDVLINTVTDAEGKTYKYADFEAVGLVKEKVVLPEYLWSETDSVQFKWLDRKIEGRPEGYTWHHSEKNGQMELVPTGIHNVYYHNGGRTINHWAYREGGR